MTDTETFYIALCLDCPPPLPEPHFYSETDRDDWARGHSERTGHRIEKTETTETTT